MDSGAPRPAARSALVAGWEPAACREPAAWWATGGTNGFSTGGVQGTWGDSPAAGRRPTGEWAGAASSPPTITNGTFASNTVGWTAGFGVTLGWSPGDAGGSTQSGSLDIVCSNGDASLTQQAGATQCLSVTAGASVHAQAAPLVPGQSSTQASINLWFLRLARPLGRD